MLSCYIARNATGGHAIADLVDAGEMGLAKGWIITRIVSEPKGVGLGREVFQKVLDAADFESQYLWLEINPYGPLNHDQLVAWYKRHGFKWVRSLPGVMVRCPQRNSGIIIVS